MSLPRRLGVAALATAATLLACALPAEAATRHAYGGSAYASTAKVGTLVSSGKTSYVPLCTTKVPTSRSNDTAQVDLGVAGTVGAATTRVSSAKTSSTKTSKTTTKVATTSLLGGLVRARAITAAATVTRSSKGYTPAGSSVFTDLQIAGRSITARPKANTTIEVPGVATVILNAQSRSTSYGNHSSAVTALKVTLLEDNPLDLPKGTIVVGSARATLHNATHHRPYGSAYGTQLDAGIVGSGKTAAVYLPCGGTSGKTRTNTVAAASSPGVLQAGAVRSTGKSTDSSSATVAATTSSVAQVSLLGGVVTLDAVEVRATATRKGTSVSRSSRGTKVVGLKVEGQPVSVSTAPNTNISIAGVGTLHLHRVVKTPTSLQVYGVQLVLSTDRAGLEKGTTLTVGSARAGVSYR